MTVRDLQKILDGAPQDLDVLVLDNERGLFRPCTVVATGPLYHDRTMAPDEWSDMVYGDLVDGRKEFITIS